jgi:gamma-glutamyltranspeptidase/glutathione hydrolase
MRRRTFIRTLPAAAVASTISIYNEGEVQATSTSDATPTLAQFQSPGEERFIRPDVHAGDRPSGASFASRSPALGCSGAAGTAHPLATQAAIEMLKRGGSAVDAVVAVNAMLGFVEYVGWSSMVDLIHKATRMFFEIAVNPVVVV